MNPQETNKFSPILWIKDAWFLGKPYWHSSDKYKALGLITLIVIFNLLTVYIAIIFNKWNNTFYDAIQRFDKASFINSIYKFCVIAFFYVMFQVLAYYFRKVLEIRWRRFLTSHYINKWLTAKSYYKIRFLTNNIDNPDQRISEDINSFIVLFLTLTLGLMNAIITLISFVIILWNISGSLHFTILTYHIVIHGYMVWVAVIYAMVGTYTTFKIGKPLINLNYRQQAYEADFRFSLMRIREYGESIAFYGGEIPEKASLAIKFNEVVRNFVAIIYRQMKIDIFGTGYSQIAIIFPVVIAAPRYFSKLILLGDLMQILNCFGRVQSSLSYFIDAYTSLSGWRAVMNRLIELQTTINKTYGLNPLVAEDTQSYLELSQVSIHLPNGKKLIDNISFTLNRGDCLLIKGKSGTGKTTLLRTIAGLWPYATGNIYQQRVLSSMFIAQKPYLPPGKLSNTILYPDTAIRIELSQLRQVLIKCALTHLISSIEEEDDWSKTLSVGEQQRIAFCRILVSRPDIIYLDEATSALDEDTEAFLYDMLKKTLPHSVIVSIGHRSTITQWHNRVFDFNQLIIDK